MSTLGVSTIGDERFGHNPADWVEFQNLFAAKLDQFRAMGKVNPDLTHYDVADIFTDTLFAFAEAGPIEPEDLLDILATALGQL